MESSGFLSVLDARDGGLFMPQNTVRIDRPLKQSALTESYLGQHDGFELPCLIRILKPSIAAEIGAGFTAGFNKACRQYVRARHASLTAMYDMGTYGGYKYLIIEYVEGIPLTERIKERTLSDCEALKLMTPIADALTALWRNDFIHRGVSPLRVLIAPDGTPKLDIVILPRIPLNPLLIEAHAPCMAGFWPPEELRQSRDIDERSDMFSFGASLYFAVTGQSPFGKGSRTELIARTMTEAPTPPQELNPEICPTLCAFIMRCLQRESRDRFTSTQEFSDALNAIKLEMCLPTPAQPSSFTPLSGSGGSAPNVGTMRESARIGDQIGQCVLEQMVGAGSFGIVYKARHTLLDMPVAVKFLPAELAARNPEYVELFLREARTAIRIRHKNVIGLYEAGVHAGQHYLIMEYASGGSVQDRADESGGMLSIDEVVRMLKDVAAGLSAAEEMNIVHRDIKPANLMYGALQEVKIADLGLAKRIVVPTGNAAAQASIRQEQLTMRRGENMIQGTPAYLAPEMATMPDQIDCRCDLYSLGVTAYQLLAGKLPFDAPDPLQLIMKHVTEAPPPLRRLNAKVSEKLDGIVMRLMAKNPADRYQTSAELRLALDRLG